jgi:imidazolonepropionase
MGTLQVSEGVELLIVGERVARVGRRLDRSGVDRVVDAGGGVALPGLVDAHTHAVFAATREDELLARLRGAPYTEGGILSSARAVAAASEEVLAERASVHLRRMLASGTTCVEVKSGYGLSVEGETKLLVAARLLRRLVPLRIVPTFLGAHAFPEGVRRDDYISAIIAEMIPVVRRRRLAQFCDVFCERGFYTPAETRTILRAARGAGLGVKLHADEFSDTGGAELAAELGATSADHLLQVSERGMRALKQAGVIPVLLPGAAFFLGAAYAPARRMIELDLPVALGTDFNPGTSPVYSMLVVIGLAVVQMKLTVEEAITAATLNAACAADLAEEVGSIEEGKAADVVLLDLDTYRQIPYYFGHNPVHWVMKGGTVVYESGR